MSNETTAMERAEKALKSRSIYDTNTSLTRKILTAALADVDLGPRISTWRRPCGHSVVLNPRAARDGEPAEYEQGCSPCLRDRMRAWLLDGAQ